MRRGRPTDNAKSESFDGPFRAACLNAHGFWSLENPRPLSRAGR
ncbi:TPA: transposase [Burkholderia multivorans]|nr:transposase [Burkholderia multivorans]MBR7899358.1 integrase core domain-containing protein [Burkholderia multivorans]MBR8047932.1 integrase core domain-containing protein [Burkholderia multivorans]MBU9149073.1 transposase [Burkholderia multivorans]MBU9209063.1 transposase [Burkholderia multivorans]